MNRSRADILIDRLAAEVRPVKPLQSPARRASLALAAIGLLAGLGIVGGGDPVALGRRYAGHEELLGLELAAMLATATVAITAAFYRSIPGSSGRWSIAPLPFFATWLVMSGIGCYGEVARRGADGWKPGASIECLWFILATSAVIAPLLIWRLARARPINPLPVALLGGLGIAAVSAFVLQFFHPIAVTFIDLAVHVIAILIVIALAGLGNRRTLTPA